MRRRPRLLLLLLHPVQHCHVAIDLAGHYFRIGIGGRNRDRPLVRAERAGGNVSSEYRAGSNKHRHRASQSLHEVPFRCRRCLCRDETGTGSMHTVIPGRCAGSNPEVRDSRFIISRFPVHRYAMPRNDRKTYGTNSSANTSISRLRVTSGQSRLKSAISRSRCGPAIARSSAA